VTGEVYKLQCFACGATIQTPAAEGVQHCPNCAAVLELRWRAEHEEFARQEIVALTAV
jgi:predicted RNA-binding Zn-ribbon protein involved in translation (DUF1610 family)